jgi:hypothetical protein
MQLILGGALTLFGVRAGLTAKDAEQHLAHL